MAQVNQRIPFELHERVKRQAAYRWKIEGRKVHFRTIYAEALREYFKNIDRQEKRTA